MGSQDHVLVKVPGVEETGRAILLSDIVINMMLAYPRISAIG